MSQDPRKPQNLPPDVAESLPSHPNFNASDDLPVDGYLQRSTFFRAVHTATGRYLEEVDINTGEVLRVHSDHRETTLASEAFYPLDIGGGRQVLVSPSVNVDAWRANQEPEFSWSLLDIICQQLVEGGKLTEICKLPGMPAYFTLSRWRRSIPGVDDAIKDAKKARAEYAHDAILGIAEDMPSNMTEATHMKTQVDAYKWVAEKGDRSQYGSKVDVDVKQSGPSVVIIQTGVPEREKTVSDEGMKINRSLSQSPQPAITPDKYQDESPSLPGSTSSEPSSGNEDVK